MQPSWLDTQEYPFAAHYFEVNGQQLHYLDEGQGDVLLFVHGTPSWSFDFRHLIKALRPHFRCLALDHVGFGLSDKPEHYDYSPRQHSATLEKLVQHLALPPFTLVVHDFGGPIGLSFAERHPAQVRGLVVLNSWLWSTATDPDYLRLRRVLRSPLLPWLYRYFNFSPRVLLPASFGQRKLAAATRRQYTRPFANRTQRNGPLAFARSLLHDQDWFQELWDNRAALTAKPTLLVWGLRDPALKPHYLATFQAGFPHAQVLSLPTCGHFPQEEHPAEVSQAIRAFVQAAELAPTPVP